MSEEKARVAPRSPSSIGNAVCHIARRSLARVIGSLLGSRSTPAYCGAEPQAERETQRHAHRDVMQRGPERDAKRQTGAHTRTVADSIL